MRSGFVALAGRPNAGKSTLLNALVDQKVAIVSDKPQTTRSEIRGILTGKDGQIVFTDTPGVHKPHDRLEVRMNQEAEDVMHEVDLIYLVVDGSVPYGKGDARLLEMIRDTGLPVFLLLNKIDKISREKVLNNLTSWQKRFAFAEYFPVSARDQKDFSELIQTTLNYLPEGDLLFPEDMISDSAENFNIAEIIREKILLCTKEEVPHACAVLVENKQFRRDAAYIQALILVEKDGQKGILIGKNGSMLKKIGTMAREDLEKMLGRHVYLDLFVRVEEEWRRSDAKITEYGYGGAGRDEF